MSGERGMCRFLNLTSDYMTACNGHHKPLVTTKYRVGISRGDHIHSLLPFWIKDVVALESIGKTLISVMGYLLAKSNLVFVSRKQYKSTLLMELLEYSAQVSSLLH
ncbi:hypothetical protein QCA50_008676 [Cerrena zonata]|uniref:Maturase K n=1 Tax=Cerrena zonata TaxID=2478898 RepID=A0AAW0G475_9APHY